MGDERKKENGLAPSVGAEFAARSERLRDDHFDALCEAEATRCLECGFRRGGHAPDCETPSGCPPGLLLIPLSLVVLAQEKVGKD